MRKIFLYIALASAGLFAALSCTGEIDRDPSPSGPFTGIRLTPIVDGLAVKSTPETGNDTYNENLISNYCWFIYSDAAGTTPLLCGFETGHEAKTLILDGVLGSSFSGGKAYVYVIANLPAAYSVDADKGIMSGTEVIGKTVSALETLAFDSAFYNYTSATTGIPAPDPFVMRTDSPVEVSLVRNTTADVTADLKRVAAKIVLDLKVAQEVKQTTTSAGAEVYKKTWQADIRHLQVYMLWGCTHGDLAGNKNRYESAADKSWFYPASPRYAMYTNPEGGEYNASTNTVIGSVPSDRYTTQELSVVSSYWEQLFKVKEDSNGNPIWIWGDDVAEADQTNDHIGDKTYGDWDYEKDGDNQKIPLIDSNGNYQYTLGTRTETRPYYLISSLPLYSMPISWNVNDAHAPFIKVILPWQGCLRADNGNGAITSMDPKTTEFYYKVLVPERTSLDANGCYHISLDLSVLGSEADEVPVQLFGDYYVVDWNEPEPMGGPQSAGRHLDCKTFFEFYSQDEMNIPVSSSHDLMIAGAPTATYTDYSGVTPVTRSLPDTDFTVVPTGNSKVTVTHHQQTSLASMSSKDISPITFTFTIQHSGNGGSAYRKTITVVQYPSLFISAQESSTYSVSRAYSGGDTNKPIYFDFDKNKYYYDTNPSAYATNWAWAYDHVGHVIINNQQGETYPWSAVKNYLRANEAGAYFNSDNNNPNMYTITTTVVDPSLSYVIGDPRTDTSSIPSANNVDFATDNASRTLTYYYPTENSSQTGNMIAPSFRTASSFGKCGDAFGYEHARARCAAYQEDGYPAGRWRIPTKAEVEYITTLSSKGLIPSLFNTVEYASANDLGYYYWSAHGIIKAHNDGSISLVTGEEDTDVTIRTTSDYFNTSGEYEGSYSNNLGITFYYYDSIGPEYINYSASTGYLAVNGTSISKVVITWFYDPETNYEYSPESATVYSASSGGSSIETSHSGTVYTTTWTCGSDPVSSLILQFDSYYLYRAAKIKISCKTAINDAFVRCVYDDWYWGDGTVDKTIFFWGDRER